MNYAERHLKILLMLLIACAMLIYVSAEVKELPKFEVIGPTYPQGALAEPYFVSVCYRIKKITFQDLNSNTILELGCEELLERLNIQRVYSISFEEKDHPRITKESK